MDAALPATARSTDPTRPDPTRPGEFSGKGRQAAGDRADIAQVVDWWSTMMSGPFAERGRSLAVVDPDGRTVAVAGVWSAGLGRPGLVEPMGVHRDHWGKGYGAAVCEAAASVLRQTGSSSAIVCAESSNVAAISTYTAAGFTAQPPVADLVRPS